MGTPLETLLGIWDWENGATLKALRALPDDKLGFQPHPKGWSMGALAWHLCTSERWFCTGGAGVTTPGEDPVPKDRPPATGAAMAAAREASHAALAAAVKAKGDAWFAEEIDFYNTRMSRERILHLMIRHEVHHRGQLSMLLRVAGAKVPAIYGPSADEAM